MKVLRSKPTPAQTAFAIEVSRDPRTWPMGTPDAPTYTAPREIDGVRLVGKVVIHNEQARTGRTGTFRACELWVVEAGEVPGHPSSAPPPAAELERARGIDVSTFQPGIDWGAVAGSGVSFVFVKALEGLTHEAKLLPEQWAGAGAWGVLRGAYHFFRSGTDPREQVKRFVDLVSMAEAATPRGAAELPLVLDVENQSLVRDRIPTLTEQLGGLTPAAFLGRVEEAVSELLDLRGRALVYTSPSFWSALKSTGLVEATTDLWLAHYRKTSPVGGLAGWPEWKFWQHTESASIPGVKGNADENYFAGTLSDLRVWAGIADTAPPSWENPIALDEAGRLWDISTRVEHGEEGLA
jgi:lysozyme